jgi:hypothetical protein
MLEYIRIVTEGQDRSRSLFGLYIMRPAVKVWLNATRATLLMNGNFYTDFQ